MTIIQDEWIEWPGGECPVSAKDTYDVQFRNGDYRRYRPQKGQPMRRCWQHQSYEGQSDIIAYKVVKEGEGG